jgi:hypothetical protein
MPDAVVPPEYAIHVRHVTAELRELIPTVASVAGRARALFDDDEYNTGVDDRVPAPPMAAAGVTDMADVARLLSALLNLGEPLPGDVLLDLMDHLDRHARR